MARLLALAVTATLLMARPGQLASAARTSPGEAETFWRAALPGSPMPDAIFELLHHDTDVPYGAVEAANDDDPPPMNFNYDDYRALPRSEATAAPSPDVLLRAAVRDEESTVFFLEDAVRIGESLPLHSSTKLATAAASAGEASARLPLELYTVHSVRAVEGSSFVVCRGEPGHGAVYGCRATGPARAYVLALACERGDAAVTAVAVCRTDTSQYDPEHAAFRLLGVKPGGAAVCHAVPDALVLSAKNGKSHAAN